MARENRLNLNGVPDFRMWHYGLTVAHGDGIISYDVYGPDGQHFEVVRLDTKVEGKHTHTKRRIAELLGPTFSLRVSAAVQAFLEGTEAWQTPGSDVLADAVMSKIRVARRHADGACRVHLTNDEAAVLREYADAMATGAADNVGIDASALGELNAGRALMRAIDEAGVR